MPCDGAGSRIWLWTDPTWNILVRRTYCSPGHKFEFLILVKAPSRAKRGNKKRSWPSFPTDCSGPRVFRLGPLLPSFHRVSEAANVGRSRASPSLNTKAENERAGQRMWKTLWGDGPFWSLSWWPAVAERSQPRCNTCGVVRRKLEWMSLNTENLKSSLSPTHTSVSFSFIVYFLFLE
jgi:hypothetical protein